ncbi:hypothetical protein [Paenibacillus ginsengarvi]|uniref:Uncharacterized protein n=1 Tax=Paenibacillus ginsengarvi TaxID=400777 RepID=A0A3B0AM72_9BACL|nr:hypothetical protein [Paenibacillus ginsengarvi]RKN61935.1 hypothetical protein D7M11_35255 [Paenibacillus ginsengarvi]
MSTNPRISTERAFFEIRFDLGQFGLDRFGIKRKTSDQGFLNESAILANCSSYLALSGKSSG